MAATPDYELASAMRAADAALKRFTAELSDVHMEVLRLVEVSVVTRFFDVWFDNLLTHLSVRDRLIAAQKKVAGVRGFQTTLPQRAHRCALSSNAWRFCPRQACERA